MSKPFINCYKCENFLDIEEAKKRVNELVKEFPMLTRYSHRDIAGICLAKEIPYSAIPFRLECKRYNPNVG